MILGDTCTRRCGFCNVKTGKPTWNDPLEPARVARSRRADGPAPRGDHQRRPRRHVRLRRARVRRRDPPDPPAGAADCKIEVLTPDFRGQEMPLAKVIAERPDVFNHNVEVVPRLYPVARRGSTWERSNRVLRNAKEMGGDEVDDQVRADGRARRELRGDGRRARHAAREPRPGAHRRPVPASDREPPADRPLLAPGRVQGAGEGRLRARLRARRRRPAGRSSSYHADQHVAQDQPGVGPLAEAVEPHERAAAQRASADRARRARR